ncbi:MAG: hypothetical protein DI535_03820 [Citrobacter freundii]|nr:MAG: hypothetical protein DI535_03820 [Citrobacter freundii]
MKTLYVIGNGFDIYHGLNTRYQIFALYLAEHHHEIYELLLQYYPLADLTDPDHTPADYGLWWRFEAALADLDYREVLEDNSDYAASPGTGEWRDSQWHEYQIQMELIINKLTRDLIRAFVGFILSVDYKVAQTNPPLKFDQHSHFLNFNYTETLQRFYGLQDDRITYIHDKAAQVDSPIVLGHGTDPEKFREPEEREREGLTEEQLEYWREKKSDEWDFSTNAAKEEILGYYGRAFKNCERIVEEKEDFFSSLEDVEKVVVLGHSLSEVDIKYFQKLKAVVGENVQWQVSWYMDADKESHTQALLGLGVPLDRIELIRIEDLREDTDRNNN